MSDAVVAAPPSAAAAAAPAEVGLTAARLAATSPTACTIPAVDTTLLSVAAVTTAGVDPTAGAGVGALAGAASAAPMPGAAIPTATATPAATERSTAAVAAAAAAAGATAAATPVLSFELPVCGNLGGVEVLPSAEELRALLQRAVEVASRLAVSRPHVANLDKLARRIRSDLDFVCRCCQPAPPAHAKAAAAAASASVAPEESATAAAMPVAVPGSSAAAGGAGVLPAVGGMQATTDAAEGAAAAALADVGASADGCTAAPADLLTGSMAACDAPSGAAPSSLAPAVRLGRDGDAAAAAAGMPGTAAAAAGGATPPPLPLTPDRVQGLINNLRGFQGELQAAQLAPGVVGVSRRFQARVPLPPEGQEANGRQPAQQPQPQQPRALPAGSAPCGSDAAAAAGVSAPLPSPTTGTSTIAAAVVTAVAVGQKRSLAVAAVATTDADDGCDGNASAAVGVVPDGDAPAAAATGTKRGGGGGKAGGAKGGGGPPLVSVEVDVVAQEGHCWIEVKNQEAFGLESVHWLGASRRAKGLRRQVAELLAVAAHPTHARRWRAPTVAVFFPSPAGAAPEVVAALRAMGAHVAVGPGSLLQLPPPPPLPSITNLDVTTMCGLVSEVSNGGAGDPAVEAWAQRTVHWVECLAAERAAPLLAELDPWVAPGRPLLAADLACKQFQVLMDMFAGPREKARWAALQQRLTVVETEGRPEALSPRCASLLARVLGRDQLAVFGLGDAARATTLSANGNAVRGAERAGVALEVVLHRPVWLTGR